MVSWDLVDDSKMLVAFWDISVASEQIHPAHDMPCVQSIKALPVSASKRLTNVHRPMRSVLIDMAFGGGVKSVAGTPYKQIMHPEYSAY